MDTEQPPFAPRVCCCGETRGGRSCRAPVCAGDTRCRWHGGRRRVPTVCRCDAYGWPHRPGSKGCRFFTPDPPGIKVFRFPGPRPPGINRPLGLRRRGWWGLVQRTLGLHPIRDRALIRRVVSFVQEHPGVRLEDLPFVWPGRELGLLDAVEVSAIYLAVVLARTKARLVQHTGDRHLKLRLNSAAPLDQMTSTAELRGPFERVLYWAWRLSDHVKEPWRLDDAVESLRQVKALPVPPPAESPTLLVPETHAAMTAYILAPDRCNGLYATVDIGAGTTDVAFFWCGREDGVRKAWYYAAKSEFVGIDDIDGALSATLGDDLGAARRRRQSYGKVDFEQVEQSLEPVLRKLYEHYGSTFGQAYRAATDEREWVEVVSDHEVLSSRAVAGHWGHAAHREYTGRSVSRRKARYVLCLVGGGARVLPVHRTLSLTSAWFSVEYCWCSVDMRMYCAAQIRGRGSF